MAKKNKKKHIPPIIFVFIFTICFLGLLYLDKKVINKKLTKEPDQSIVEKIAEQVNPYQSKDNLKKVSLVQNFKNTVKNSEPTKISEVKFKKEGVITGGFLYIKSRENNGRMSDYSNIYLKLLNPKNLYGNGGHLQKNRSLETPDKNKDYSELLYKLSDIPFHTKIGSKITASENWLEILNQNQNPFSILSFSSTEQSGEIVELSFYYQCLENTDCSIYLY